MYYLPLETFPKTEFWESFNSSIFSVHKEQKTEKKVWRD